MLNFQFSDLLKSNSDLLNFTLSLREKKKEDEFIKETILSTFWKLGKFKIFVMENMVAELL